MPIVVTRSSDETAALGEQWGRAARTGWVIGLSGDLGAGKTQLVKGLARGLGLATLIASPTFALVNEHRDGRLPLFHLDLYRLDSREQIIGAGLEEYLLKPAGVTVVEWAERYFDVASPQPGLIRVSIETLGENERRITYEDIGA